MVNKDYQYLVWLDHSEIAFIDTSTLIFTACKMKTVVMWLVC